MKFRLQATTCLFMLAVLMPTANVFADPALTWITRLGGETPFDHSRGVAVAASGNIYVVGRSYNNFGTPLSIHAGTDNYDILLAKFNSDGQLQWHTYLGTSEWESGEGLAVDANENIFVVGYGFMNFGGPINNHAGAATNDPLNSDILIAKYDQNGTRQWMTFHGTGPVNLNHGENDRGFAIDIGSLGDIYVTGYSEGPWGNPISGFSGNNVKNTTVLKLNASGELQWHTFHYGQGWSIKLDDDDDVFVAGISAKTWGNPRSEFVTNSAQLFKLNTDGALLWNTFAPGQGSAYSVDLDEVGNIYIAGAATQAWAGDAINPFSADTDIAIARFIETGFLDWQTFHGSNGDEIGATIKVGPHSLFVIGAGQNTWGVPLDAKASPDGTYCGLALELAFSGELTYHSFQCGESGITVEPGFNWFNLGRSVSGGLNPGGQPLITGTSDSGWGTPVADITGNGIFLAQLDFPTPPEIVVEGNGQDIADGDISPSLDDDTDFGGVAETDTTASREFTILNLGIGDLELTGVPPIALSGDHAVDFTITQDPITPVTPGAETTFEVTFDPAALGLRSATVSITNTDEDENPFTFSIQGMGELNVVEMAVLGTTIDGDIEIPDGSQNYSFDEGTNFGNELFGNPVLRQFVIRNSGNSDLVLSGTPKVEITGPAAADFTIFHEATSPVAAGTQTVVLIEYRPGEIGGDVRTAHVNISNNDADENPYDFGIQGEAYEGFTLGGTVNGLIGTGLKLQYRENDVKTINASGPFTFDAHLFDFQNYHVTIHTQPTGPDQSCSVQNGQGTVIFANVTDVIVNCDAKFTVGGTVTGLMGSGVELLNNCGDSLEVNDNGSFQFPMFHDTGDVYSVSVKTQPTEPGLVCVVSAGEGSIFGASITDVLVTCGAQGLVFEDSFEDARQPACP